MHGGVTPRLYSPDAGNPRGSGKGSGHVRYHVPTKGQQVDKGGDWRGSCPSATLCLGRAGAQDPRGKLLCLNASCQAEQEQVGSACFLAAAPG